MKSMTKEFKIMLLANSLLIVLFLYANYYVWVNVNNRYYFIRSWSPVEFGLDTINPMVPIPLLWVINLPFFVFWLAIALNLYFIVKLQRKGQKAK